VDIDEAGQQSGVTEVDDFCALGMLDRRTYGTDALAHHQHFARLEQDAGVNLEQPRRMKDDGSGRSRRGLLGSRDESEACACKKERKNLNQLVHGIEYAPSGDLCRVLNWSHDCGG
jgi:hypothetical protein